MLACVWKEHPEKRLYGYSCGRWEGVPVPGVLFSFLRLTVNWGKLNRNQKSSSYFKMKPENMQEPLTQCGRMSLTEALFHSSASVPPFPESSLLSRALHALILYSILGRVSSTPFYKWGNEASKVRGPQMGQSQNVKLGWSGIIAWASPSSIQQIFRNPY